MKCAKCDREITSGNDVGFWEAEHSNGLIHRFSRVWCRKCVGGVETPYRGICPYCDTDNNMYEVMPNVGDRFDKHTFEFICSQCQATFQVKELRK